jgi:cytochrome c oxidase cbb3-type subunit 2
MTPRRWILPLAAAALLCAAGCAVQEIAPAEADAAANVVAESASHDPLEYPQWETNEPGDYLEYNRRVNLVQRGREVYAKYCVGCHGEAGMGDGPASVRLITKPRDFTSGIYKFRSTDSGSLPMETDLYRTITRGLSGVSMPSFPLMPHRDKLAVIEYIKRLYPGWENEAGRRNLIQVPRAPADVDSARRVDRGRIVYVSMQCTQCHGTDGRGKGATQTEYVDAWGNRQKAFDFSRGSLKGGNAPEDIYRTFHTGLRSIMPSFDGQTLMTVSSGGFPPQEGLLEAAELERLQPALADFPETVSAVFELSGDEQQKLGERNSWDLVAYIRSLRQTETTAAAVLGTPAEGATP